MTKEVVISNDFLTKGNILEEDENTKTSLHYASALGRKDVLIYLIDTLKQKGEEEKRIVNLQEIKVCFELTCLAKGKSLLHYCAQSGHSDLAVILVERGANVNEKNIGGQTGKCDLYSVT